jgi:hypothetical protein
MRASRIVSANHKGSLFVVESVANGKEAHFNVSVR